MHHPRLRKRDRYRDVAHDDAADALGFSGVSTDFLVGYVAAVAGSSGGVFVGDLTAAGADAYEFGLMFDPATDLDRMSLQMLTYHAPYERWRYPLAGIIDRAYHHYSVPLTDPGGWIQELGSNSFAFMLANVNSVRLRMYDGNDAQTGVSGRLNNFSVVAPEPGTLALSGLGLLALAIKLRRRRS